MESVASWVQEIFAPVVLTCSTSEADRISQKNNLSVDNLLNGFACLNDANTPLRSVTHPIQLASFNFRFLAASQFRTLEINEASKQLNECIKRHPPQHNVAAASAVELDIPRVTNTNDVAAYLRVIGVDADANGTTDPMPWYRSFKYTLMDTFRCEEYSLLCHPVAMLVVVSSTDPNPRHSFEQLTAPRNLPLPFQQGLYDATLLSKYYVVLHDVVETKGTGIDPDAILTSMNITSVNGTVLRINSLTEEEVSIPSQFAPLWMENPYVRPPLFLQEVDTTPHVSDTVGTLLSSDDVNHLKNFVREFGLQFLLSSLEGRIFQLNEVVSAMKKGVKNVFKSWLRKPKDSRLSSTSLSGSVFYKSDAIESQTRLLADTAFLVRDYELALQMYRLVREDYKSDKSLFHCANVNEMIALCLLVTKGSPMQITNALDAANAIYAKAPSSLTQRMAIRTAVIAGEIFHALSKSGLFTDYMDNASAALIRGSTMEQGICSAILMERAALCDMRARLPKFRKYGFRMVMAGHVYDSLGHKEHAARCYSLARAIYDCSGWFLVEDHINFVLAQQASKLDDRMASIILFLKLIGTGRNSASQQEAMLYDFGLMVKDFLATEHAGASSSLFSHDGPVIITGGNGSVKRLLVRDLRMPELDEKSTVVFAATNAFGIDRSIDGNLSEAEMWQELSEMIDKQNRLHHYVMSKTNDEAKSWFAPSHLYAGFRNKKNVDVQAPENYVLGEQIYVEFVMKNALSCAVDVEKIHLFGKFETAGENKDVFDIPERSESGEQRIVINSVNLQLLPCSEEHVRLAVCPQICGKISLTGVRWSICGGDVQGELAFNIPGPFMQDTREHQETRARARAPNMSLIANVIESMPWLGVKVDHVFAEHYVGELIKLKVYLVNSGTAPLGGLQVCCADLQLCASEKGTVKELCGYIGANGHIVDLSAVTLAPGERKDLTLWARGAVSGQSRAALLFKYTTSSVSSKRPLSRTVKIMLNLDLQPCIDVSYTVEPSFEAAGEYILGITVSNKRRNHHNKTGPFDGMVQLEELLCISNSWAVEKLTRLPSQTFNEVRDSLHLGFFEASTSYFRVVRRHDNSRTREFEWCKLPLSSRQNEIEWSATLPIEQFLCLEHAAQLARAGNSEACDGTDSKRGNGFRTIQSVRRENKALKIATGEDGKNSKAQQEPQPTSKDALLSNLDTDGHLVLVWSTEANISYSGKASAMAQNRAIGQVNLTSVKIRPPTLETSCPLTVTLKYKNSIELQRSTIPGSMSSRLSIAELDVFMQVCNDSAPNSAPLDVTVEMLHPEEAQGSLPTTSSLTKLYSVSHSGASPPQGSPPSFFWTGVTKKNVARFLPNNHVTIKLKACFIAPGIYNLNRFRFEVQSTTLGQPANVFMLPADYFVYVMDPQDTGPPLRSEIKDTIDELLVPVQ